MSSNSQRSAETVISLAEHMARLKEAASIFYQSTQVRERGYFCPNEDEQVVQLWISYHMSRNALLELITDYQQQSYYQQPADGEQIGLSDFVVAYAGAIVLVDAARFLRELFSEEPVIRRKLNEAFGQYGIESGSFDAIQMSLSDPVHVIQLYQARHFFEEQAPEIKQLAEASKFISPLLEVIDRLGKRLQVSAKNYAKTRAQESIKHLFDKVVHRGVGQAIYSIQSWVSRWVGQLSTLPSHRPELPTMIKSQLLAVLRPGDVLVTRKEHSLTNYFLPGYWPHAALYIGHGQVIEALADGVRLRSVESPFAVDAIAAIRPILTEDYIDEAIQRAHMHVGKPYDFDFDFTRADRMVCTEVVYRSYEGIGQIRFQLTRRAARENISAEDLLNLGRRQEYFHGITVFCPPHSNQLLNGQEAEAVLQATMGP